MHPLLLVPSRSLQVRQTVVAYLIGNFDMLVDILIAGIKALKSTKPVGAYCDRSNQEIRLKVLHVSI